ncbi:MAG: four helix bundle protein [Saprospirales bacterium]|nr:four helix bundle protein [Saprospirales bacterium]
MKVGRFHYLDNAKFCRNSRGSLMELLDHLLIAQESEYITNRTIKRTSTKIK